MHYYSAVVLKPPRRLTLPQAKPPLNTILILTIMGKQVCSFKFQILSRPLLLCRMFTDNSGGWAISSIFSRYFHFNGKMLCINKFEGAPKKDQNTT